MGKKASDASITSLFADNIWQRRVLPLRAVPVTNNGDQSANLLSLERRRSGSHRHCSDDDVVANQALVKGRLQDWQQVPGLVK